jgi:predicted branched-subunit amino acid permease
LAYDAAFIAASGRLRQQLAAPQKMAGSCVPLHEPHRQLRPSVEIQRLLNIRAGCHHHRMQIVFTQAGFWRGVYRALPLALGLAPFGFVTGLVTAHHGLSLLDCMLMNGTVYAGAAQLVALANWTHPAPIVAAAFAAFVVNIRFALMGPALAPWLDGLSVAGRYASLALLVDHPWAISVTDIRRGGRDAALFVGLSLPIWVGWMAASSAGFLLGRTLNLPPQHPIFFGALAAFIALLVPLWRSKADVLPWLVAGGVAAGAAELLPHTSWYILIGALSGCLTGGILDWRKGSRHG